jgi:hypothetical protein
MIYAKILNTCPLSTFKGKEGEVVSQEKNHVTVMFNIKNFSTKKTFHRKDADIFYIFSAITQEVAVKNF